MADRRVKFVLTMPVVASWDGRWSGEDREHFTVRKFPQKVAERIVDRGPYLHRWDDGWTARIGVSIVPPGTRIKTPYPGIQGYEWMVANIAQFGQTDCPHEWGQPDVDGWARCRHGCGTSHKTGEGSNG